MLDYIIVSQSRRLVLEPSSFCPNQGVKVTVVPNFTVHRLPLRSFQFHRVVRDLAWGPPASDDSLLVCAASGDTVSLFRYPHSCDFHVIVT